MCLTENAKCLGTWGLRQHVSTQSRWLQATVSDEGTRGNWCVLIWSTLYTAVALFCNTAESNHHLLQQFPQDHTGETSKSHLEPATWGISCLKERNKYLHDITMHLNLVLCQKKKNTSINSLSSHSEPMIWPQGGDRVPKCVSTFGEGSLCLNLPFSFPFDSTCLCW